MKFSDLRVGMSLRRIHQPIMYKDNLGKSHIEQPGKVYIIKNINKDELRFTVGNLPRHFYPEFWELVSPKFDLEMFNEEF
jgi:hypothetical protein